MLTIASILVNLIEKDAEKDEGSMVLKKSDFDDMEDTLDEELDELGLPLEEEEEGDEATTVSLDYICEECDYRWSTLKDLSEREDDQDDYEEDVENCPMCGSTDVIRR